MIIKKTGSNEVPEVGLSSDTDKNSGRETVRSERVPKKKPRRGRAAIPAPLHDDITREIEQLKHQLQEASDEIEFLTQEVDRYRRARDSLSSAYQSLDEEYRRARYQVLKPLYRRVFRGAGWFVRSVVGNNLAERIRARVPQPDGVPSRPVAVNLVPNSAKIDVGAVGPPTSLGDVFVFSIIDWEFRIQRPQHISRELSANHRVFYVEMTQSEESISIDRLGTNLYRVRLPSHSVGFIRPYTGRPSSSAIKRWLEQFFDFCDETSSTQTKHVVVQHPFWWQFLRHLPPEFSVVFDCMDDIGGFSNTEPFILSLEHDLIKNCDQLIVSSDYLYKKHAETKRTTIIRNAGQIEHFSNRVDLSARDFPLRLPSEPVGNIVKVGYVGAIAEWFDWQLILAVAKAEPNFHFHFCGSVTAPGPKELEGLPNVHFYGEVAYKSIPAFIAQMDVMTIPFHIIPLIEACDPVKFYEYSAMGKPTVAARLPELQRARELVYFASTPDEFRLQVRRAVASDEDFKESLVAFARNNTWKDRASQFQSVLEYYPQVSVVVLSYGDPSWTLATLNSLLDRGGHYPNMEIIVVDNGSTQDSLKRIRSSIQHSAANISIIENGANLGFAGGNNVGIKAANGAYILLLNNDTYVAPGAIHAMVSHLERDPNIGVVGPLTNNIGNEARIEVSYKDMSQMKRAARSVTTGYRGVSTELRVVAYFAAMFRAGDFEKFGLLSEEYGRGMFEDDDHCQVIRSLGYTCALAEDAFVHHHLSGTFSTIGDAEKRALFEQNRRKFEERWGPWIPHQYRSARPLRSFDKIVS